MRNKPLRWKPAILAMLALAGAILSGCGAQMQKEKAQSDLDEARKQLLMGQFSRANTWTDRAIARSPDDAEMFFGPPIASTSGSAGLTIAALYTEAIDDPDLVRYCQIGARKFTKNPLAYVDQLDALERLGRHAEAQAAATRAAALLEAQMNKPGGNLSADIVLSLAHCYVVAGNPAKGWTDYQSAITAYPSNPEPYNAMAYDIAVENDQKRMAQALTLAKRSLAIAKQQASGSQDQNLVLAIEDTVGWILYRQGKYEEALSYLLEAMDGAPRLPEIRYHVAMVYLDMDPATASRLSIDSKAAARATLKQLLQLDPTFVDAKTAYDRLPPAPADDDIADAASYLPGVETVQPRS